LSVLLMGRMYAAEMISGGMIYITSFITIGKSIEVI
jgi:hypothetical protein